MEDKTQETQETQETVIQKPKKYTYTKEKAKEYNTKYYSENKDKKYMCEVCRKEVNYFNKSKHIKTDLHQRLSK